MFNNSYSSLIASGTPRMEGPVTMFEPGQIRAPQDELYTVETLEAIRDLERGTYALLPDAFGADTLNTVEMGCTALFNEVGDLGKTRDDSRHMVEFGQLLLLSVFGEERSELVAIKPFDLPREAATEYSLTHHFSHTENQRIFRTFEPKGFARMEDGTFGMITKYEHGVRSLDNVFLNPEFDDNSPVIERAIGKCAYLLAAMHSEGYTHGDAQVKNMFVSNFDRVFIADLESTRPFPHNSGHIKEMPTEVQIDRDLNTLIHSMRRKEGGVRELSSRTSDMFGIIYTTIVSSPKSEVPVEIRKSMSRISEFFDAA